MTNDQNERKFYEERHALRQPSPEEDNAHDLFPTWLAAQVPDLTTTRYEEDSIARCKFFTPDSFWTWYVIEAGRCEDREGNTDILFFGYVEALEREFGYFSLIELQTVRGSMGMRIQRDVFFTPRPISSVTR